jgi:ligand-binding sensor domain-containing protein/AraC-like DNA-binding protein
MKSAFLRICIGTFLVLMLFVFSEAFAFRKISVEQGLSNNFVRAIHRDSYGFIWFGTLEGIDRFDGEEIISFANKLPGARQKVNCITNDPVQGLLIGTDQGLYHWDFSASVFKSLFPADVKTEINDILVLQGDSLILAGASDGAYLINRNNWKITKLHTREGTSFSASVTGIASDGSDNNIWMSSAGFLVRFNISNFSLTPFSNRLQQDFAYNNFRCITIAQNQILVGTYTRGVYLFDTGQEIFKPYKDIDFSYILTLSYSPSTGNLYAGTDGNGLIIKNLHNGNKKIFSHDHTDPLSLSSNAVYSFLAEENGRFWVGTYTGGVNFSQGIESLFTLNMVDNGMFIGQNSIRSVYVDKNQNKYIGTRDGLYISLSDRRSAFFNIRNSKLLRSNIIISFMDAGDRILLGTFRGGITQYNPRLNRLEPFAFDDIFHDKSIYGFARDKDLNIWIGAMDGIWMTNASFSTLKHFTASNSQLPDNRVIATLLDSQQRLWTGSIGAGTAIFNIENEQLRRVDTPLDLSAYKAVAFYEDKNGYIWISTEQDGLCRVSPDLQEMTLYTVHDGLPGNSITAVTEAPENIFWISTLKGFVRLDANTDRISNYSMEDGLPGLVFNRGSVHNEYNLNGKIWFGSEKGLISFYPDSVLGKKSTGCQVRITDMFIAGKRVEPNAENQFTKPLYLENEVVMRGGIKSPGFRFVALNFANPGNNHFLYRLMGRTEEWQTVPGNTVTFADLSPGNYRFEVCLADENGLPQLSTLSYVDLILKPRFYQSGLFKMALFILLTILLLYGFRFGMQIHRRIQKINEEKSRVKYEASKLTPDRSKEIESLMMDFLAENKIYLNPDLKINDLAREVHCSPRELSQVINQNLNLSFTEIINRYRIEHFKTLMNDPAYMKYTLTAIAELCGFNSKASFYRAFKKISGQTPAEYYSTRKEV